MEQQITENIRSELVELLTASCYAIGNQSQIAGYFDMPYVRIVQLNKRYQNSPYDWFTEMMEDWIHRKGPRTLQDFVNILEKVENFTNLRHQVYQKFTNQPENQIFENNVPNLPEYELAGPIMGYACIVNIVNFTDPSRNKRCGTEPDVAKLEELFKDLSLKTCYITDKTKDELIQEFQQFLQLVEKNSNENQCIVIVVMTYASDFNWGSFVCSDLQDMSVEDDIIPIFNTPKLKGIPKIFMLEFYGRIAITPESARSKEDIMVIYGGFGTGSNRHEVIGSWFIEIFCDIVRKYKNVEIKDLIQLINLKFEKNAVLIKGDHQHCGYYQYRFKRFRFSKT